jgi:D-cysteine desulfhydrase
MTATLPLFRRYPSLAQTLPWLSLARLPTPLDDGDRGASAWGIGNLRIKRDDLAADLYGGNKLRKLEFILADARARDCDAVVTFGAAGSNHALATAIYARSLGLQCHAVLTPQPPSSKVANTLRYHAWLGTTLHAASTMEDVYAVVEQIRATHPGGAERVYQIPWGGSSWLGNIGFVNAALELAEQWGDQPPPDRVFAATGTMGTNLGLAVGFRLLGWPTIVECIRVVPHRVMTPEYFERLFRELNTELHQRCTDIPLLDKPYSNVSGRDEFLGEGYAIPTAATTEAVELAKSLLNLGLETTYTGKAMAALIHDARAGKLEHERVIFWQTYNSRPYPPESADIDATSLAGEFARYF